MPFSHFFRWLADDEDYKYDCFIPIECSRKDLKSREGEKSKGALSQPLCYAYDFHVHCYVGHLRRVHASNPPMEVEVTDSSGTKTRRTVKASEPLAEDGALYYYHSKTKMYGEWFVWTCYEVVFPTYRNVLPIFNITTLEGLDSISETRTVILLCKFSVILSNLVTYCAILSNIGRFPAHQSTEEKFLSHSSLISSWTLKILILWIGDHDRARRRVLLLEFGNDSRSSSSELL